MKIKENKEKISVRKLPVLFAIFSISAAVVRTLQMFKYIDHETGFNIVSDVIGIIFYVIVAVGVVIFTVTSYLSKQSSKIETQGNNNIFVTVLGALFALSLIYDGFSSFGQSTTVTVSSTGSLFKDMMISGSLPLMMKGLFAFLSSVYIFILSIDFYKGTQNASKRKILSLAPIGWVSFRLIHCFVRQISFVKVSDLLCELIMLSFMILFFMALAQVTSSIYSDGFRWRIPAFGYSSCIIAFALSVSRLIYSLVNGADALNVDHPFNISDLLFSLFAVSLILAVTNKQSIDEVNEQSA